MRRTVITASLAAAGWTTVHNRSPAVRAWHAPRLPMCQDGPLSYRVAGPEGAETGILLLHGLVATGDVFGTTPATLAQRHRVVVPDLLGFGRSLDEDRSDFSTAAHLEALDELVALELGDRRIRIGAHSMGSAIALRWAASNSHRVDRVVCVGPPIWPDAESAENGLSRFGPMGKSLILDDRIARAICSFNCRHRTLSGILSAAMAPRWPIPIARQASLHTWPAYLGAIQDQVIDCPWTDLVEALADERIPVRFIRGDRDTIGDAAHLDQLSTRPGIEVDIVAGDHTLPAAEPHLLADALA